MAYLAVDEDEVEYIFSKKPRKWKGKLLLMALEYNQIPLPPGSIEKLIGRKLTWEDEPVELKEIALDQVSNNEFLEAHGVISNDDLSAFDSVSIKIEGYKINKDGLRTNENNILYEATNADSHTKGD